MHGFAPALARTTPKNEVSDPGAGQPGVANYRAPPGCTVATAGAATRPWQLAGPVFHGRRMRFRRHLAAAPVDRSPVARRPVASPAPRIQPPTAGRRRGGLEPGCKWRSSPPNRRSIVKNQNRSELATTSLNRGPAACSPSDQPGSSGNRRRKRPFRSKRAAPHSRFFWARRGRPRSVNRPQPAASTESHPPTKSPPVARGNPSWLACRIVPKGPCIDGPARADPGLVESALMRSFRACITW